MNKKLATAAHDAVYSGDFELGKGYCSRFVRQVVASVYGSKYANLFGASAIETGHLFEGAGLTVNGGPEEGDILVKMTGSGGFGHIGIYVGNDKVAENSSTGIGRVRGALGFRSLEDFGTYQLTDRIQEEQVIYKLFFGSWDHYVAAMLLIDGSSYVRVRTLASVLGVDVAWDQEKGRVIWGGTVIEQAPYLFYDESYLPLRTLVDGNKYSIEVDDTSVLIKAK